MCPTLTEKGLEGGPQAKKSKKENYKIKRDETTMKIKQSDWNGRGMDKMQLVQQMKTANHVEKGAKNKMLRRVGKIKWYLVKLLCQKEVADVKG